MGGSGESVSSRLNVYISSTPGELTPEREAASSAIRSLRLSPVLVGLGSAQPEAQAMAPGPGEADVFIGIYWQSYGWVDVEGSPSQIEEELKLAADRPRLLYLKEPAPEREPALISLLAGVETDSRTAVRSFEAPGDLAELVVADLATVLAGLTQPGPSPSQLPEGTMTFMFCDLEGSTTLLRSVGADFSRLLADYHRVIGDVARAHGGQTADIDGDRAFVVFPDADNAVEAAIAIQIGLADLRWGEDAPLRCRIGLHTGTAALGSLGYVGLDVHRAARIASSAHGGQIVASTAVKALTEGAGHLWEMSELGSYALKGLSRAERLYQVVAPGLRSAFPPPRARSSAKVRLPVAHGTLIGRHREVQEVAALLALPEVRLVTLTGPGGVGKTRVALAAAEELSESFPDGVYFVSLATVSDPEHIAMAIGEAAGIPIEGDAFDAVSDAFQHQQVLLVLDNFEQVVEGAPLIGRLLDSSPGLEILLTSRVVLRIGGEHEYTIDSLPTPSEDESDLESVTASPAAQLFVDRAEHVAPGFRLGPDNAESIARISRLVEGLPLALELAAARLRTMSPASLADRLGNSLEILGRGAADLPDRQRTLEAAIDWSYQLLTPQEQKLFTRLGVFSGGFTVDSVQDTGDEGMESLDLLASLVDNSMVLPVGGGTGRMRMLAPIRDYSLKRLQEEGGTEAARDRHAEYFMQLCEQLAPDLRDRGQAAALQALHEEWPNLEAAANWLVSTERWVELVRLSQGMWVFVWIGNHIPATRAWLLAAPNPPHGLDARGEGHYWWLVGGTGYEMGDYPAAQEAIDKAIPLLEANDDDGVLAWAQFISGLLMPAFGADPTLVMEKLDEALNRFRSVGDRWGEGYALIGYGILAGASGDFDRAEDYHRQCRALGQELGNEVLVGHAETQLGFTYLASGRPDQAREALGRAVDNFRPLLYREGICYVLEALAALSFGEDRPDMGMIALGAAEGVRSKIGLRPWPAVMWFFDMLSGMADGITDSQLQAARNAGRRMSPFDAVDLVLAPPVEMGADAVS